jgi:branched-chain amino acid transport system substrate-binding protein
MNHDIGRRTALATGAAASAMMIGHRRTAAQAPAEVKVALIAPISGPWGRQGTLMRLGGEMAVDDINAAGGIKALAGAKLRLLVFDAGDSPEKAKNAAQRMLAQEPDLIAATGAWFSGFTLAVTEVTERGELPFLTFSYSDLISSRGFRYVFQTSMTADRMATRVLPTILEMAQKAVGARPTKVAIIADNGASNISFLKQVREVELKRLGLTASVDETFTPPLSDATTIVQKVRGARPEFVLLLASNIPDTKLLLDKFTEFGLSGGKLPLVGGGTNIGAPELRDLVAPEVLEGLIASQSNWPGKGQEELVTRFAKRTGEPWMTQDAYMTYADMLIFRQALEAAGVAERHKVADAIRALDLNDGPALYYPGHRLRFDSAGRRMDAQLAIIQWQRGQVVTIYPEDVALAPPLWPKR